MTPERLQGVTLAERLLALADEDMTRFEHYDLMEWASRAQKAMAEAAAALSAQGGAVAWLEPGTLNSCDASIFPALQRDYPDTYRGWFPVYATPPSEG